MEEHANEIPQSSSAGLQINETSLTYIGRNCTRIPAVFLKLQGKKIEHLDLSFNSINKLNGLEGFSKLKELILDNNEVDDDALLPYLPTLKTLSLNKNNITDIVKFVRKVKYSFPNLTFLSLLGNKACTNQLSDSTKDDDDYRRYRYFVLHHLRNLKFLDSAAVTSEELNVAAIKGQFMHIKKPRVVPENEAQESSTSMHHNFTPLPRMSRPIGDHKGAYATFKYRYANRESEGNRFIMNNDL